MQIIENAVYMGAAKPGEGGAAVIDTLNVTPSTSAQVITAPEGTDGYSPVNVAAVTSSIDANIVAGNIKKDVSILGVTGSYEGNIPTGTLPITTNGVYDVTNYASADVQVPTPTYYIEKTVDANGILVSGGSSIINLTGVTDIGFGQLYAAYYQNSLLTTVNIPNVKKLSNNRSMGDTFGNCSNLVSANFNSLEIISGNYTLSECFIGSGLTDYDLSRLTTTSGNYALQFCFSSSKLTNAYLQSLKSISGTFPFQQAYQYISTLTNVYFPALKTVSNNNTFNKMLQGCTGVTVHFPSNMQSVIGSWSDVTSKFGGSSCQVLFDLPATVTLTGANSVSYERNPRDDTATSLAWRINTYDANGFVLDWTSYYTSGTTDPAVSDTIYSDAACTVPVTTISSIA